MAVGFSDDLQDAVLEKGVSCFNISKVVYGFLQKSLDHFSADSIDDDIFYDVIAPWIYPVIGHRNQVVLAFHIVKGVVNQNVQLAPYFLYHLVKGFVFKDVDIKTFDSFLFKKHVWVNIGRIDLGFGEIIPPSTLRSTDDPSWSTGELKLATL